MQTKRYAGMMLLLLAGLSAPSVQAAAPDAGVRQSQMDEAREAELERQRRLHPPRLEIETPAHDLDEGAEGKGAVFHIQRIERVDNPQFSNLCRMYSIYDEYTK